MRALRILPFFAVILSGCGKDPFAGRDASGAPKQAKLESPVLETNAERFDRGLVDAYEKLVVARGRRDAAAYKAAFAGAPGDEGASLYEETTGPSVARIHHQFQKADGSGDRVTLTVKEIIEERDPKTGIHNAEVIVTATLVKTGGAWKVEALKAKWS